MADAAGADGCRAGRSSCSPRHDGARIDAAPTRTPTPRVAGGENNEASGAGAAARSFAKSVSTFGMPNVSQAKRAASADAVRVS